MMDKTDDKTYYMYYVDEGKKEYYPLGIKDAIEYLKTNECYQENVDVQQQLDELFERQEKQANEKL